MQKEDYRATLLIILGLAAASLTGLARQAATAHQLGAGRAADIYLVAFALPEFAFVALPIVLSPAFLPLFARRRIEQGETSAWHFAIWTAVLLTVTLAGITVLASVSAPFYLAVLSPGFTDVERHQALQLSRLMLPAIAAQGLVVLAGAALQVYRRFVRPALATAVYNIAFCAALFFLPAYPAFRRAAWGVLLGTLTGLVFQISLLWKYRPSAQSAATSLTRQESTTKDLRQLARLTGPMAAGYAVHHVILLVDRAMATALGAGSAASLHYAYHLALIVGQTSGLAVSTALFPRLAEQTAIGDTSGVRASLAAALRFVLLIGLPATCALVLLRTQVVRILLERGAFGQANLSTGIQSTQASSAVSQPLLWYALAVLADAFCQPLWRAVYAQHRPWTVLAINGVQTAVRLLGNLAFTPALGYSGLALSAAVGLSLQVGVLGWWAWRQIGAYLTRKWWSDAGRIALATVVSGSIVGLTVYQLGAVGSSPTPPIFILAVGGGLGAVAYLSALWVLGMRLRGRVQAILTHPQ